MIMYLYNNSGAVWEDDDTVAYVISFTVEICVMSV